HHVHVVVRGPDALLRHAATATRQGLRGDERGPCLDSQAVRAHHRALAGEHRPTGNPLGVGPCPTDRGLHRLVIWRPDVVGCIQPPLREWLPLCDVLCRVDGNPGNAGRFESVFGQRVPSPDGRHDVFALRPLVTQRGTERVVLLLRDLVNELLAIGFGRGTLPSSTTGSGCRPLLIPGLPLAGIVQRLALGARDPLPVIVEDLDLPRILAPDNAGVVVVLLQYRAGLDTLGCRWSLRSINRGGRAVRVLDLDGVPVLVQRDRVAFGDHLILASRSFSGLLEVRHVGFAPGGWRLSDYLGFAEHPRRALQDVLSPEVSDHFARATGDMDGRAHALREAADGASNRPRIIRHADATPQQVDTTAHGTRARRPRQRVGARLEDQAVEDAHRPLRGLVVHPVLVDGIAPVQVGGAVIVNVVAVLVEVHRLIGVLPDPYLQVLGDKPEEGRVLENDRANLTGGIAEHAIFPAEDLIHLVDHHVDHKRLLGCSDDLDNARERVIRERLHELLVGRVTKDTADNRADDGDGLELAC